MSRRLVLLRAVNVGGRTSLPMVALRHVLGGLGLADIGTVLQTGNAVFTGGGPADALGPAITDALRGAHGVDTLALVREANEWRSLIAANPFAEAAKADPSHLMLFALEAEPSSEAVERLRGRIVGRETIAAFGRALFIVYPDGIGRSKLTNALIERALGMRGTGRNWKTAGRIAAALTR